MTLHLGLNAGPLPLTATGAQLLDSNFLRTSRNPRAFNGATVDPDTGLPTAIPPGGRVEYQFAWFPPGLPSPYSGEMEIMASDPCEVEIRWHDAKTGAHGETFLPRWALQGYVPARFTVRPYARPGQMTLVVWNAPNGVDHLSVYGRTLDLPYYVPFSNVHRSVGVTRWMKAQNIHLGPHARWALPLDPAGDRLRLTWAGTHTKEGGAHSYAPIGAILHHHSRHGGVPWVNLGVNISDEHAAGIARHIADAGKPVILEYGNEWNIGSSSANAPHNWGKGQGKAVFGATVPGRLDHHYSRAWGAYRLAQIMRAMDAAGNPALHLWVYCDLGTDAGWVDQVFGPAPANIWAASGLEPDLLQWWRTRLWAIGTNAYTGRDITWHQPSLLSDHDALLAAVKLESAKRINSIRQVMQRVWKYAPQTEMVAYEGGLALVPEYAAKGIPSTPERDAFFSAFNDAPQAKEALEDLFDKADDAGMTLLNLYCDVHPRGAHGYWDHVPHWGVPWGSTPKSAAIAEHVEAFGQWQPPGAPLDPLPDPEPPEPDVTEPEPDVTGPPADVTTNPDDVTTDGVDSAETPEIVDPEPPEDVTQPPADVTEPPANVTKPVALAAEFAALAAEIKLIALTATVMGGRLAAIRAAVEGGE